jgi:hypothetical protein
MGATMTGSSLGGGGASRPDLERTPDGFHRTRLRYGKGLRGRFLIKLTYEAAVNEGGEGDG